jgi:hypothetical protein
MFATTRVSPEAPDRCHPHDGPMTTRLAAISLLTAGLVAGVLTVAPQPAGATARVHSDFNGDGWSDLAVGSPDEDSTAADAGSVQISFGGSAGLAHDTVRTITQTTFGFADDDGDRFGAALTTGDLDGDGYADLAIGAPGEAVQSQDGAGMVFLLYGSPSGLVTRGTTFVRQGNWSYTKAGWVGLKETPEAGDHFGAALATADFDGDGEDDLLVGSPDEDLSVGTVTYADAGVAQVVPGGVGGLDLSRDIGVQWPAHSGRFGAALAGGQLGHPRTANAGGADAVIGSPGRLGSGRALVLYGIPGTGLTMTDSLELTQTSEQDPTGLERFGAAIAIGNVSRGTPNEIVVGAPADRIGGTAAGSVFVFHPVVTSGGGVTFSGYGARWSQAGAVPGDDEGGDQFGSALAIGNFGKGDRLDLAIGAPGEDLEGHWPDADDAGNVYVLFGVGDATTGGLSATGSIGFSQDVSWVPGEGESNDRFGAGLIAGQYGGNTLWDLAIATPSEDTHDAEPFHSGEVGAGMVTVVWGGGADGFSTASGQTVRQLDDETGDHFGTALG